MVEYVEWSGFSKYDSYILRIRKESIRRVIYIVAVLPLFSSWLLLLLPYISDIEVIRWETLFVLDMLGWSLFHSCLISSWLLPIFRVEQLLWIWLSIMSNISKSYLCFFGCRVWFLQLLIFFGGFLKEGICRGKNNGNKNEKRWGSWFYFLGF